MNDDAATIARLKARVAELEAALAEARQAESEARQAESEARQAESEARRAATHDPLTGLLNRRGLEAAWSRGNYPSGWKFATLDLDDFKVINDQHGHAAGDAVLQAVAHWLRELPLATRLGGDEFVVLVDGPGRLPHRVGATLPGGPTLSVGLSVGLAPARGGLYEEALPRADAAMYRAKRDGTRVEHYVPHLDDRLIVPRAPVRLRDASAAVALPGAA